MKTCQTNWKTGKKCLDIDVGPSSPCTELDRLRCVLGKLLSVSTRLRDRNTVSCKASCAVCTARCQVVASSLGVTKLGSQLIQHKGLREIQVTVFNPRFARLAFNMPHSSIQTKHFVNDRPPARGTLPNSDSCSGQASQSWENNG